MLVEKHMGKIGQRFSQTWHWSEGTYAVLQTDQRRLT